MASSMAEDTDALNKILSGGEIRLSFSAGRQTPMENTFQGELDGTRGATYHMMSENDALGWHFTTENLTDDGCRYILKADQKTKLKDDSFIIFTIRVEHTLKTWVENNQHNLLDVVTGDLNNDLKKILWDVVRGLKYLKHKLSREHGNLNPSSIFVVAGRGRLGKMSRTSIDPSKDIDSFHDILDFIFPQGIPPEASSSLIHLYDSLKPLQPPQPAAYEDRIEVFYNCDLHVALLSSAEEKSTFRRQALLNVRNEGPRTFRQVEGMLNGCVPGGANWIQNAINAGVGYENVLRYRQQPYKDDAMSFLVYSRNLVEHARQQGITDTLEEIERKLETILPMCLAIFLKVVSIYRIPVNVHLG